MRSTQDATGRHAKAQSLVEGARTGQYVPDTLTYTTGSVNAHILESSQLEGSRCICRGLTALSPHDPIHISGFTMLSAVLFVYC